MYLAGPQSVRRVLGTAGSRLRVRVRRRVDRTVVEASRASVGAVRAALEAGFGRARVADGDEGLPEQTARCLLEAGLAVALAESCTGGLVAKLLSDVPGSSGFLRGGIVAYSNDAKTGLLGVAEETIATHGAVSQEVVEAMARGALRAFDSDVAIAVSGIAGPGGGTPEKPVGTVWMAVAERNGSTEAFRYRFGGTRAQVREQAAAQALLALRERAVARIDAQRGSRLDEWGRPEYTEGANRRTSPPRRSEESPSSFHDIS